MKGIPEIDSIRDKVKRSRDKLGEVKGILRGVKPENMEEEMAKAKKVLGEVEINMENEEIEVRRGMFEMEVGGIFAEEQGKKKIQLEEFKEYEREFDSLKSHIKDDRVHGKFLELKSKVSELTRKINRVASKEDLDKLQAVME